MKQYVKDYLQNEFDKRELHIRTSDCTSSELFHYLLLFKEGFDIPMEVSDIFMDCAKSVIL